MIASALLLLAPPLPPPPELRTATRTTSQRARAIRQMRARPRPIAVVMIPAPIRAALAADDPANCAAGSLAAGCETRRRARYLAASSEASPDFKLRALRQDGRKCAIVGPELCPKRARRFLVVGGEGSAISLVNPLRP